MPRPSRPTTPRLAPVANPTAEQREVLASAGTRPDRDPLNIFATMVHNRRVANRAVLLGGAFLGKGTIPGREREIVILRVGHRASAVYEFGQHVVIGRREGLTDDEIADLARDELTRDWAAGDRALIAMADELCADDCVGDATWATLAERYTEEQLVELLMLAGYYRMISGFLNSAGVQLDDGVPGWPSEA
ncbi:carboxymuconolactone decarboxylase family protein [Actinomarinicola tropica]|uniref:Carboxymuconolactone decarboxylase family protein n=1 Tax=Actinomarinicola tropica TaxID=2789776 RepID=A0A5Q2RM94_9ACTN|nr:carboxymuconolactone decarboxylase family protein [Actinomarinicola tropica]QGG96594.1 carboxymuconolactone decarboxylase family protein [Actinomarinicola tropica]